MSNEQYRQESSVLAHLLEEKKGENSRLRADLAELRQAATRLRNRFNEILHKGSLPGESRESIELYARIEQLERERLELAAALENSDDRNSLALARIRSLEEENQAAENRAAAAPDAHEIKAGLSDSLQQMLALALALDRRALEYNRLLHDIESERERSVEIEAQLERKSHIAAELAQRVEASEAGTQQLEAEAAELRTLCDTLKSEAIEKERLLAERSTELENALSQMNMLDQRLADQEELIEQSQKELSGRRKTIESGEAEVLAMRRRVEEAAAALADERVENDRLRSRLNENESQVREKQRRLDQSAAELSSLHEILSLRDEAINSATRNLADLRNEIKISADSLKSLESDNTELKLALLRLEEQKLPSEAADLWEEKLKLSDERERYSRAHETLNAGMRALRIENEVLNRQLMRKIEEVSELAAESAELRSRLEYIDLLAQESKR